MKRLLKHRETRSIYEVEINKKIINFVDMAEKAKFGKMNKFYCFSFEIHNNDKNRAMIEKNFMEI